MLVGHADLPVEQIDNSADGLAADRDVMVDLWTGERGNGGHGGGRDSAQINTIIYKLAKRECRMFWNPFAALGVYAHVSHDMFSFTKLGYIWCNSYNTTRPRG